MEMNIYSFYKTNSETMKFKVKFTINRKGSLLIFFLISFLTLNAQIMKQTKIKINGEDLYYLDSEQGDTTLLFIHGAFINKEYWLNQLSYFAPKYRSVALDLAGHGNSTNNRSEWTVRNYGQDISEFMQKLSLKNVIVIGHSFGADVMLEAVDINPMPIIGIIEIDQLKNVGVQLPQENIDQLLNSLKADFAATCEYYARQALITEKTDTKLTSRLMKDFKGMNPKVGIPLLQNNFNYAQRETELLEMLELKLHLVHVDYTPTNEESLTKYLGNNYELHKINGSCHYPMLENPDKFNTLLMEIFLEINK